MSLFLHRAHLLLTQSRYDLAKEELLKGIAAEPDNGDLYSYLALTLYRMDQNQEALAYSRKAIELDPNENFSHFVHAQVLIALNRYDSAQEAAQTAIALETNDASSLALLSEIYGLRGKWSEALDAAQRGLACDPQNERCLHAQVDALIGLRRDREALAAAQAGLEEYPDDAVFHGNVGWALLHNNEPEKAVMHFRESLRLDPTMENSQEGIAEALRARGVIYRHVLAINLYLHRLSYSTLFAWGLGVIVAMELLGRFQPPGMAGFAVSATRVLMIVGVMVYLLSRPIANLVLRFDAVGRLSLTDKERRDTNWLLAAISILGGLVSVALIFNERRSDALIYLMLTLALAQALNAPLGLKRKVLFTLTAGLFALTAWHCFRWWNFEWTFDRKNPEAIMAYLKEHPEFVSFFQWQMLIRKVILWGSLGLSVINVAWIWFEERQS